MIMGSRIGSDAQSIQGAEYISVVESDLIAALFPPECTEVISISDPV